MCESTATSFAVARGVVDEGWLGNDTARTLYKAASFETAYGYHYRYRPSS